MVICNVKINFKNGKSSSFDEVRDVVVDYQPADDEVHRQLSFKSDYFWPKESVDFYRTFN